MAKRKKAGKIEKTAVAQLFLVNLAAELRPLLKDAGLGGKDGVVIFVEKSADADVVQRYLLDMGAVMCKNLTALGWVQNNRIGLHLFQLYDKNEDTLKFLAGDNFTPTVLVHSILPDCLRNYDNLLVLNDNIKNYPKIAKKFNEFQKYIHKYPQFAQNNIRLFMNSRNYSEYKRLGGMSLRLRASAEVYIKYYRESHNDDETGQLNDYLDKIIRLLSEYSECYCGEWDNIDAVRNIVFDFLEKDQKIEIGSLIEIEGELAQANQRGEAIFWDEQFYYFPEHVLKFACKPMLDVVSFLEIKRELQMKGYLKCHNIADGNFTVKKTITNAFGYKIRQRFLVIRKDFFDLDGELTLEERRGKPCALELPAESLVE